MDKYQKYTLFTLSLENSFEFGFNYIYLESRIVPGACACACVFHNSFNSHAQRGYQLKFHKLAYAQKKSNAFPLTANNGCKK